MARDVSVVAAGFGRTCIAGIGGEVRCWGDGASALVPEEPSPIGIGRGKSTLWAHVVWAAESAERFVNQNILITLRELAR